MYMKLGVFVVGLAACVGFSGCSKDDRASADGKTPAAAVAVATECDTARDSRNRTVSFRSTVDAAQLSATGINACAYAEDLVRRHHDYAATTLEDFCSDLLPPNELARLRNILGKYSAEEINADPQMRRIQNAMNLCTKDREQALRDFLFVPAVYSIGTLPSKGAGCAAYLYELSLEGKPGVGYQAALMGTCAGQVLAGPEQPPDVLAAALVNAGYTGALPATYSTPKGETLPFAPKPSATPAVTAGSAVAEGGIPKRFQGVYEEDAAQCASAVDLGGATDRGLTVRDAAIENYELGCKLKGVTAATEDAFIGVFECFDEGEPEPAERTRTLRRSQGKLLVDANPTPLTRCDLEPPPPFEPKELTSDDEPRTPSPAAASVALPEPAPTPLSGDDAKVAAYARELSANWMSGGTCGQLRQVMLQMSQSGMPANVRVLQMEKLFDKAYDVGCILQ